MDCRNGSLLMRHERHDHDQTRSTLRAHSLLCSQRGSVVFPGFPVPRLRFGSSYTYSGILSKEEGDDVCYFYVSMQSTVEMKHTAYVYMLQDGVWVMHSLTIGQILPPRSDLEAVLIDNKMYMPAAKGDVVVLDLMASTFSTIQLPEGVEHVARNTILSRADDSAGVYLINVKKLELRIWLHKGGDWLLVDSICLRDMLAGLSMLDDNASLQIKQVGDNAEYVLLEMMSQYALYLDIKCRTLRKVYDVTKEDRYLGDIHPFMMIWPPTFPALKDDPATARDAM
uniref:F-box protein AT5G49610-like beta-propeller domain-containing protein n=1 Tax=Hordeum vulgare subsp. vulgare TaxID=112509 RepID=A0A8I6Y958_HORVV